MATRRIHDRLLVRVRSRTRLASSWNRTSSCQWQLFSIDQCCRTARAKSLPVRQQFPDGLPPCGVWGSEGSEEGFARTMGLVRLALS